MKHIRNSVKGVFFLEHQGVPTATLTDFNETIKDGSLCVDRNNQDLYISDVHEKSRCHKQVITKFRI